MQDKKNPTCELLTLFKVEVVKYKEHPDDQTQGYQNSSTRTLRRAVNAIRKFNIEKAQTSAYEQPKQHV